MACGSLSQGLGFICGGNTPGLFGIWVSEYTNITGLTVSANSVTSITMSGATKFYPVPKRSGANTFSIDQKLVNDVSTGQFYYNQSATFAFPKLNATSQGILNQMAVNDVVVVAKDLNNVYWLLGSDHGLSMVTQDATSGKGGDLNGYNVTIGGNSFESYPWVQIPFNLFSGITSAT